MACGTGRSFCWTEGIIVTSHLRNAAGACALSIGLLVCSSGGAIAFADQTEPGSAATGTPSGATAGEGTTTATSSSTSTGPASSVGDKQADVTTVSSSTTTTGITTSTSVGGAPVSKVSAQTNTSTPSTVADDDADVTGVAAEDLGEAEVGAVAPSEVKIPALEAITPSVLGLKPRSRSNRAEAASTKAAGNESGFEPATAAEANREAELTAALAPGDIAKTVVVPVSNAVVSIARALGQVTFTLAQLPTSKTPVTDVIVSVSVMVGSVVGAVVEVAKVPGDLVTLLGANTPDYVQPPLIGAGGAVDRLIPTPVDVPLLAPQMSQSAQVPVAAVKAPPATVVPPSNIGAVATTGLKNELSLSGLAPVRSSISPATTSFLDHVVSSVLAPASLTALAAIALPGLGGLLIVCAAGIRVGYRQAKAGLALRASGIARFAGPGPMGVVRSGSLISLHSRTPRLGKPLPARAVRTQNAPRLLESVA